MAFATLPWSTTWPCMGLLSFWTNPFCYLALFCKQLSNRTLKLLEKMKFPLKQIKHSPGTRLGSSGKRQKNIGSPWRLANFFVVLPHFAFFSHYAEPSARLINHVHLFLLTFPTTDLYFTLQGYVSKGFDDWCSLPGVNLHFVWSRTESWTKSRSHQASVPLFGSCLCAWSCSVYYLCTGVHACFSLGSEYASGR